jgi:hypothetical protein
LCGEQGSKPAGADVLASDELKGCEIVDLQVRCDLRIGTCFAAGIGVSDLRSGIGRADHPMR